MKGHGLREWQEEGGGEGKNMGEKKANACFQAIISWLRGSCVEDGSVVPEEGEGGQGAQRVVLGQLPVNYPHKPAMYTDIYITVGVPPARALRETKFFNQFACKSLIVKEFSMDYM